MKCLRLLLLFVLFCLCGCSSKTPVMALYEETREEIASIKKDIDINCKNNDLTQRLNKVSDRLDLIQEYRTLELKQCENKVFKLRAFSTLISIGLGILLFFFVKSKLF